MDSYASSSAAATKVTPFTAAPQTTNAGGLASQAAAVTQAAGTSAGSAQSTVSSQLATAQPGNPLLQTGANLSTDYTDTLNGLLNTVSARHVHAVYSLYNAIKVPLGFTTGFNDIGLLINFPASQFLKFAPHAAAYGALPKDALGAGLGAPRLGRGTLFSAVRPAWEMAGHPGRKAVGPAELGHGHPGHQDGRCRLVGAGPEAVPAAALGEGGLLSSMSVAGMLGSALGAGAPDVCRGPVSAAV